MPKSSRKKSDRRRIVWQKAGGKCAHCGKPVAASSQTIDHCIPQAFGGGNDLRNLMPLCSDCNRRRSSNTIEPATFYEYADRRALDDLMNYAIEWRMNHSDAYGEMIVKHPDQRIFYGDLF